MTGRDIYIDTVLDRVLRLLAFILSGLMLFLLFGCKTQYVPVETVSTVYEHHTDTVKQTDSIKTEKETIIREARPEDSLMLAKLGIRLKENERAILVLQKKLEQERSRQSEHVTDTVKENDTIRVPYPVEGKVPKWEKVEIGSVGFVGGLGFAVVGWIVLWIWRRYKRC